MSSRTPKFANTADWNQADLLMQPALIRVIDNIRKQLDQSSWKGDYQQVHRWSQDIPLEQQSQVIQLQKDLETASDEEIDYIQSQLDQLPRPYPGYLLCLTHADRRVDVDLWELCYQVCFINFKAFDLGEQDAVEIDTILMDERGEVDWIELDRKAKQAVQDVFDQLPL